MFSTILVSPRSKEDKNIFELDLLEYTVLEFSHIQETPKLQVVSNLLVVTKDFSPKTLSSRSLLNSFYLNKGILRKIFGFFPPCQNLECPVTQKNAKSFKKTRFSNMSILHNYLLNVYCQGFNWSPWTSGKRLPWKIVWFFPCMRVLIIWKNALNFDSFCHSEWYFPCYYRFEFDHWDLNRKLHIFSRAIGWK